MHPILESLNGTQDQWLVDLLFAFNRGDLDKFDNIKTLWAQQVYAITLSHFSITLIYIIV
jgi:hypothetical protein